MADKNEVDLKKLNAERKKRQVALLSGDVRGGVQRALKNDYGMDEKTADDLMERFPEIVEAGVQMIADRLHAATHDSSPTQGEERPSRER